MLLVWFYHQNKSANFVQSFESEIKRQGLKVLGWRNVH